MSTRAYIVLKEADKNKYTLIYNHWDGYPEGLGVTLRNYYNNEDKARELLSHGDASFIRPEIGDKNDFDNPNYDYCLFYHRDRGDSWEQTKPRIFYSFNDIIEHANKNFIDYIYLFDQGRWKIFDTFESDWYVDEEGNRYG